MFHGLPSCDFMVPTLYGKLSNPSAILLETGIPVKTLINSPRETRLSRRERSIFGWFSRSPSESRTVFFKVD
jgi:hypothetical protein